MHLTGFGDTRSPHPAGSIRVDAPGNPARGTLWS
jgi:hypothetical protein